MRICQIVLRPALQLLNGRRFGEPATNYSGRGDPGRPQPLRVASRAGLDDRAARVSVPRVVFKQITVICRYSFPFHRPPSANSWHSLCISRLGLNQSLSGDSLTAGGGASSGLSEQTRVATISHEGHSLGRFPISNSRVPSPRLGKKQIDSCTLSRGWLSGPPRHAIDTKNSRQRESKIRGSCSKRCLREVLPSCEFVGCKAVQAYPANKSIRVSNLDRVKLLHFALEQT
jgi:hypothetical protein